MSSPNPFQYHDVKSNILLSDDITCSELLKKTNNLKR